MRAHSSADMNACTHSQNREVGSFIVRAYARGSNASDIHVYQAWEERLSLSLDEVNDMFVTHSFTHCCLRDGAQDRI